MLRSSINRVSVFFPLATMGIMAGMSLPARAEANLSDAAYNLLAERVSANQSQFFIYRDADSGFNHGFPSGFFGTTLSKMTLNTACIDDPGGAGACSTDTTRLDRERGNVMSLSFASLTLSEFVGINIEEPQNWGVQKTGTGYDLRGATSVAFDVRSPTVGGVRVQFGVGGHTAPFVLVPQSNSYTHMSIDLASIGLTSVDLSDVHILFTIVTNGSNTPNGGVLLIDNIQLKPAPTSQQSVPTLPLANETFGVVPLSSPDPGRVAFPLDQLLRNLASTYEASLVERTLLGRGETGDLAYSAIVADALVYALTHDNHGLPLPIGPDGSIGLHDAYECGDLPLSNSQGVGAGEQGDVRFAGFTASSQLCGGAGYCLVLDGATGGNNAFAILALLNAYERLKDERYLEAARIIGRWVIGNLRDNSGTGFGGYHLGYPDQGRPKVLILGKSTENNSDIFAAMQMLALVEQELGNAAAADIFEAAAYAAGDFVMEMFDPAAGRFYAGTVPTNTPTGSGIDPSGPQRGDEVINAYDFLDATTFTILAMAHAPRYRDQIDWRIPMQYVLDTFGVNVAVGGDTFEGFGLTAQPTAGPAGVAWEFTGQVVVAAWWVDELYQESQFAAAAEHYLDQIRHAQQSAPFGDGRGLVASTLEDGANLQPIEQCLSTPFQCIAERVGLAATTWAIFSETKLNPLSYKLADSDGDGVSDIKDGCPNDPNKTEPGNCGCGTLEGGCAQTGACCINGSTCSTGVSQASCINQNGTWQGAGTTSCQNCSSVPPPPTTWYRDIDGDGYGDPNDSTESVTPPPGYVSDNTDECPDDPNKISPGQCGCGTAEGNCPTGACCINGITCTTNVTQASCTSQGGAWQGAGTTNCQNCQSVPPPTWYRDIDADEYGDPNNSTPSPTQPSGYVQNNQDCDDDCSTCHPGKTEFCTDHKDNDCNGQIDENCDCLADSDADGVTDCNDNCRDDANSDQADKDGDDTGDLCDGCPDDPNKTEPGVCGCGILEGPCRPPPPPSPECGDGAAPCGAGGASMMPMTLLGLMWMRFCGHRSGLAVSRKARRSV